MYMEKQAITTNKEKGKMLIKAFYMENVLFCKLLD